MEGRIRTFEVLYSHNVSAKIFPEVVRNAKAKPKNAAKTPS